MPVAESSGMPRALRAAVIAPKLKVAPPTVPIVSEILSVRAI
jgi:hypothetical protein